MKICCNIECMSSRINAYLCNWWCSNGLVYKLSQSIYVIGKTLTKEFVRGCMPKVMSGMAILGELSISCR